MSERAKASGPGFWGDANDTEVRERYQTLVNTFDEWIYQLGAESRFVAVNDVIVEMAGYAREELLDKHVSVLLDDGDGLTLERENDRLRTDPTDQSELLDFTVRTAEGEPVRVVGTVHDITERKRQGRRTRFLEELGRELQPLSDPDEIMATAARTLGEHLNVDRCAYADVDKWIISISDEGIGTDPGDIDRVFEVFESLHTPDDHSGMGISLALCERIIERHDGDIWVESEPGEGSMFTFTLPADGEYNE